MNVLYVVGACLTKNTSANMSHNAYVQGLLENGCKLDILMAQDSWGQEDAALPTWKEARYFHYPSTPSGDRLKKKLRKAVPAAPQSKPAASGDAAAPVSGRPSLKAAVRSCIKKAFYICFPQDPVYPLEATWLKKARSFRSDTVYDLVVSNSSPAASHKLVQRLIEEKKLNCKRWVQIWEDPWYYDLYGGHSEQERQEEHALLKAATEVYYVSPLTLTYQKRHYPDCAHKMKHIPLPYLDISKDDPSALVSGSFGYFGDYYSKTRNLLPFYEALRAAGAVGSIYGDSDLDLSSTDRITVSGRVTLDILAEVQATTEVLVHLCNLCGGQIPGKIYHYSATTKPILFILDGTEEEQDILCAYFSQFDRYYFCENTTESILSAIRSVQADIAVGKTWRVVEEFSPRGVVSQLWE